MVCDKIKIPLVNHEIRTRNNELKSKASERPPPPVVELSNDKPDRDTVSLVGSFGLMAGYKEFVERDLGPDKNLNYIDNTGEAEMVLPDVTPNNEHLFSPMDIVPSMGQTQLPDATNILSSTILNQLPDATADPENDTGYRM